MIICLLGKSGSGKSTIEAMLEKNDGFHRIISYTSRKKRPAEENGKDYFFMDREIMERMYKEGSLIELIEYQGNYYGTPKVEARYSDWVIVIEQEGFKTLKNKLGNTCDVIGIGLKIKSSTSFNRCMSREGSDYNQVAERVEQDREIFDNLESVVDKVVNADREINEVYAEVLSIITSYKQRESK